MATSPTAAVTDYSNSVRRTLQVNSNGGILPAVPNDAAAVTPHDTNDLSAPGCLFVGTAGNISVILQGDTDPVTFVDVQGFLPILVKRVRSTSTTATNILVLRNI